MRPRLKSLTLSGFRSFVDDGHTIDFPESGLELLQGHNKDTGGSSGSGKSSVLLGIAFALGYSPFPATSLVSRGAKNTLKVELRLDTAEGEVRIKRSSSPVQVWIDGVQVKGGAKAAEERLRQIMGVEPEVLSLLTYRGQRKPGLFLSKTDAEKKELLTGLLRLDKFEAAIEKGTARVKELETSLGTAQERVAFVQARLTDAPAVRELDAIGGDLEEAKAFLVRQEQILARARQLVEKALKSRADQAKEAFDKHSVIVERWTSVRDGVLKPVVDFDDTVATGMRDLVSGAQFRITTLTTTDNARQAAVRGQRQALQKSLLVCRQTAGQLPLLEAEQDRLDAELAALDTNTCPTCQRPWSDHGEETVEIGEALEACLGGIANCEAAALRAKELEAEIAALPEFEPNPMIGKLKEAKAKAEEQLRGEDQRRRDAESTAMAEYRRVRAEAESALSSAKLAQVQARDAILANVPPELTRAEDIARDAKTEIANTKMGIALYEQELGQATEQFIYREKLESELARVRESAHETELQLNEERDLLAAIGREGFLGAIFDEVLDEISDETNRILASVANTRHCTFHFRSETTTQKGTTKKAIVPVITVDGIEAPLESGISGGMLSVVELAVDLAVGAVVSRREGACPGWLVLDECFEGLGPIERESCMEILTRYAQDRLVLVVDHATEFKSMFRKSINVSYEAGKSTFV